MASKRVAASVVEWAKFTKVCPNNQLEMLRAVKAKHDSFLSKVHSLPENLPKIDFAAYKSRLPNPAMADAFQKSYESLSIPYPKDKDNLMQKVEAENQTMDKNVKAFVAETTADIEQSRVFLEKMATLPKYTEMTEEMMNYYFPESAMDPERPTIWPHDPAEQPYNPDFKYVN